MRFDERIEARVRAACLARAPGVMGDESVGDPTAGHPGRSVVFDRYVEPGSFYRRSPDDSWEMFVHCTSCRKRTDSYLFRASRSEALSSVRGALGAALWDMSSRWGSNCYEALDLATVRDVQES